MTTNIGSGKSLGQVAYEAYAASVGGKAYDGKDLPKWGEFDKDPEVRMAAWEAAGSAVGALVANGRGHAFPNHKVPPPLPRV